MSIVLSALQRQRRDTAANWTAENPTLLAGEIGIESDTLKWKVGDGSAAWNSLAYIPGLSISAYPLVNADIASNAEIAVSKLADGAARQLLQTDAAGTGVEWASNIDIPGTLDVTGAATFDAAVTTTGLISANGKVSFPLGTAALPSLYPGTDTNTGIYSPGADQVAISTNGTGRLFVDANGLVGVNADPLTNQRLRIATGVAGGATPPTGIINNLLLEGGSVVSMMFDGTNTSTQSIYFRDADTASASFRGALRYTHSDDSFQIFTNGTTERLRIDSTGRLGLGTSSPDALLTVNGVGAFGAGTAALPSIARSSDLDTGAWFPAANTIAVSTAGVERLRIDSTGRVGIGTTSPNESLEVAGNIHVSGADRSIFNRSNNALTFGTNNAERARIDSSGRLLVGTSTASSNFFNVTITSNVFQIERAGADESAGISITSRNTGTGIPFIVLARSNATTAGANTLVTSGQNCGQISFQGNDGTEFVEAASIRAFVDGTPGANDMPGRLVFSVTLDGASSPTEAFRITNDRVRACNQAAPAAVNATATLTVANLKTGIITSTSAAATDMTLPTGTDTEEGFSGIYTNMTFEWSVINTGPSLVTVLANTAHTLVGSGAVATGTSARFASRRSAANTFVTYRLS
jgi:hypothetical protein